MVYLPRAYQDMMKYTIKATNKNTQNFYYVVYASFILSKSNLQKKITFKANKDIRYKSRRTVYTL